MSNEIIVKIFGSIKIIETKRVATEKIQPKTSAQTLVVFANLLVAIRFPFFALVHIIAYGSQIKKPPGVVKVRNLA